MSKKNTNSINSLALLMLFLTPINNATALSAITARTIQGTLPSLFAEGGPETTPTNKNDVLYFKIADGAGGFNTFYGDSSILSTTKFPDTLKLNDFITPDSLGGQWDNYQDTDGDFFHEVTTSSFTKTLTNSIGKKLSTTDILDPCYTPYKLTLEAKDVTIKSHYGDPATNNLGDLKKDFIINVKTNTPKICFLRPLNMAWFGWNGGSKTEHWDGALDPNSTKTRDSAQGGGVSKDFIISKGFDPNPSASEAIGNSGKFPTTGFKGAEFTIVMAPMADGITGYNFTTTNSNITITQKPSVPNEGKIRFDGKITSATIKIDGIGSPFSANYTFNISTWVNPYFTTQGGVNSMSYTAAQAHCGGLNNLPERKLMTNTPRAFNWPSAQNTLFTRAIGTIAGEWGSLSNNPANTHAYKDSGWIRGYYWTSEKHTAGSLQGPYLSGVKYGSVVIYNPSDPSQEKIYAVCKG